MKIPKLPYIALAVSLMIVAGCTTVVRENIISSVNTGIGLSLAENPKTELYEVKLGYIRSQFYSVPTGKIVEKGKGKPATEQTTENHPAETAEIVSGIKMNSDFRHLFVGASVAENFAVGKVAVMSPAAVAMYIADAKSNTNATAAADAAKAVGESEQFVAFRKVQKDQAAVLAEIRTVYKAADDPKQQTIRAKAKQIGIVSTEDAQTFLKQVNLYANGTQEHMDQLTQFLEEIKK